MKYKLLLSILLVCSFASIIFENHAKYTVFDYWKRFPTLKFDFYNSQYVNKETKTFTPDEHVYAFAGGALIQGANPILILPEAPPLGKYLIGLSAVMFNNENIIIMLVCGALGLYTMYAIGLQIYSSKSTALVPPLLISLEPLYRNQYKYVPLFDIAHLLFLLSSLYFFNKAFLAEKKDIRWMIASQLSLGAFISTKFYMAGFTIVAAAILVLLYNRDKPKLLKYAATLPIAVIFLYVTYIRVLILGYPFNRFLGIQRWIYNFWTGKLNLPFTVWPLIFANRWYVWWGDKPILSDSQWNFRWPLVTATAFITVVAELLHKVQIKKELQILLAFTLTYGAFASIGQTSARYLVIYLPILYMVAVYLVEYILLERIDANKQTNITETD